MARQYGDWPETVKTGDIKTSPKAKMWHSVCSISPKSDKRQFFDFTGFSFKKYMTCRSSLFQLFRFKKNFGADKFSSETPPSMLLSLRLTKDFDKEEMTSR